MSWESREYARQTQTSGRYGGGGFGGGIGARFGGRPVVLWLIVINVLVFVLDAILARTWGVYILTNRNGAPIVDPDGLPCTQKPLDHFGHFSAATAILHYQAWRFLTFQFLHATFGHLLFNMLGLYFFGPMVESYLGSRRFLAFYLLCGVMGPIVYLLFWAGGWLSSSAVTPLVGASAGIFGVLIGAAVIAPNARVMLLFPPIPMKLRTLALILVGLGAFTVLFAGHTPGSNAGGQAAHLGGAGLGFFLIRNQWLLRFAGGRSGGGGGYAVGRQGAFSRWRERRRRVKAEADHRRLAAEDAVVDRILAKVRRDGLASLTEAEKATLQHATDRKQRAG